MNYEKEINRVSRFSQRNALNDNNFIRQIILVFLEQIFHAFA